MLALSIRQPFAELILRGVKKAELRSRPTTIIGERFYIYACKAKAPFDNVTAIWSRDLRTGIPPAWMIELAEQMKMIEPEVGKLTLPRGVIVGSAVIDRVTRSGDWFQWHLKDVERNQTPR